MTRIPRKGVRALPRAFNAHNTCVVENCGQRATYRVRMTNGVLLDLCDSCVTLRPKEAEIVERAK